MWNFTNMSTKRQSYSPVFVCVCACVCFNTMAHVLPIVQFVFFYFPKCMMQSYIVKLLFKLLSLIGILSLQLFFFLFGQVNYYLTLNTSSRKLSLIHSDQVDYFLMYFPTIYYLLKLHTLLRFSLSLSLFPILSTWKAKLCPIHLCLFEFYYSIWPI